MSSPSGFTPGQPGSAPSPRPGFTPVPPAPQVPPMRTRRSFAGPFVLITVGVLCLMGTMGILSRARMWHLFANYWPVLLIVWGLIKFIEHQQANREGLRPPGIGAGGVFLAIMIVVFGLISTQIEHFNWSGLRDQINIDDNDFNNMFGQNYNFDDHLEQTFPAGASLKIIDTRGTISVHTSDDNHINVVVRKRIGAESQSDADKYNNETKPTIAVSGNLVTLDAKAEGSGDHSVETDLDISLPRKAAVTVSSRRGDVNVTGREGNVEISAQHSDTSVEDVTGSVKVSQEKGTVKVQQVTGDVHVDGRVSEVSVADVQGAVQLDGDFQESVKLDRIAKSVTFKSSRTDLELQKLEGSLDLDSDDLHADRITGPLHLMTRSKNVRLDQVSGDVRLQDDNGTVEVILRSLGNVQIDNRSGDIQLSLPEKPGFRVDARTRDGEIQSDFPDLHVNNDDRESKATGSVGNGSAHLVLNNEHGGIEIRHATMEPPKPPEPPAMGKPGKALPAPKVKVEPTEN